MKTAQVTVRFRDGLHSRPAAKLVQLCQKFRSQVSFRLGNQVASARSLLSLLCLGAPRNTQLEVLVSGEDEEAALEAARNFFLGEC